MDASTVSTENEGNMIPAQRLVRIQRIVAKLSYLATTFLVRTVQRLMYLVMVVPGVSAFPSRSCPAAGVHWTSQTRNGVPAAQCSRERPPRCDLPVEEDVYGRTGQVSGEFAVSAHEPYLIQIQIQA